MGTSYTIPEEIIGIPLFVPSQCDFFSVEPTGMPDGKPCIKVLGATSRNYKAYQDAPVITPPIFTSRNSADWSMSFWIKAGNLNTGSGLFANQILLSTHNWVANSNWQQTGSNQSYGPAFDHVWSVCHYAAGTGLRCGVGFFRARQAAAPAGVTAQSVGIEFTQNVWTLVTFNVPQTAALTAFINNSSSGVTGGGGAGDTGLTGGQKFGIGSYSDQANQNGRDGDWYIGRLTFYDHLLTLAERSLLYGQMFP